MPFDQETAAQAGRKGGKNRWIGQDPAKKRTVQVKITVSPDEREAINDKAASLGLSVVETIVRAVADYCDDPGTK